MRNISPQAQLPTLDVLDPDTILRMEYEYARETIEQATEDRRKVFEFFIWVAGALGSVALALAQIDANRVPNIAQLDSALGPSGRIPGLVFALIFWLIGLTGIFTLLYLIRLRQAWHDSMRALVRIKEFYAKRFPQLEEAFHWRAETLPPLNRVGSITFNLSLFIVLLDSLAFGGGVLFLDLRAAISLTTIAVIAGLLTFGWQAFIYFAMLRE